MPHYHAATPARPTQENNATQARLLDAAREDLAREQRAASELRRVQAEERERFTRSLQEQNDLLTAAQAAQHAAGAMLEAERRAHREAQAELERQTVGSWLAGVAGRLRGGMGAAWEPGM